MISIKTVQDGIGLMITKKYKNDMNFIRGCKMLQCYDSAF